MISLVPALYFHFKHLAGVLTVSSLREGKKVAFSVLLHDSFPAKPEKVMYAIQLPF